MDTIHSLFRSARVFFCATFLSRFTGFLRDMAMAFSFGSSAKVGAFLVAFRLAHLFRRLLGEGNLQSGFIPQFESFRKESFAKAVHFYREASLLLTLASVALIALCEIGIGCFLDSMDSSWREIAELTMWMLPGLLFICLSGLNQALLQAQKKTFWSAAAPIVFNGVWIAVAIYAKEVKDLAVGVTLGCALQWATSSWHVRKECVSVKREGIGLLSPSCRDLVRSMALGLVGVAAAQVNSALDAIFARVADLSGPVYLWYAARVSQLPLALFGFALSSVLLAPLSRAVQNQEGGRFYELFYSALRQSAVLIIPSTLGLFALGGAGLNLLYGHGNFALGDVEQTLACLWAYAIGLFPSVLVALYSQVFYARALYWIPARASLIAVLVNMGLNTLFVFGCKWGAVSIALATSLSSFLNIYLLMRQDLPERALGSLCGRLLLASSLAASLVLFVQYEIFGGLTRGIWGQGMQLAVLGGLYIGGVWGGAQLLAIREIRELWMADRK